ncbi:MAG: LysR family transcriptional regulator [Elusimicrobiota bacterium]
MNIETLKVFKDLIDTQSFTKTAELNYISQSAVSQQIKKLEMIFKTRLFLKKEDGFELTRVGKDLYNGAKKIVEIYDETIAKINVSFEGSFSGGIRISSIYSVGIYILDNYIRDFLSKYPTSKISLDYYEWEEVIDKIINGHSDFGFVACKKIKDINLTFFHVADEEMVFVSPSSFNEFEKEKIKLSDISNVKLVFFERNMPSRKLIESIMREKGVNFHVTMEMNNVETIKAAVMSNAGFSILPYSSVMDEIGKGRIKIYRFEQPIYRPVYMIYNKRRKMPHDCALFMNFLLNAKKNKKL